MANHKTRTDRGVIFSPLEAAVAGLRGINGSMAGVQIATFITTAAAGGGLTAAVAAINPAIAAPVLAVAVVLGVRKWINSKKDADRLAAHVTAAAENAETASDLIRQLRDDLADGTLEIHAEIDDFVKQDIAEACVVLIEKRQGRFSPDLKSEFESILEEAGLATKEQVDQLYEHVADFSDNATVYFETLMHLNRQVLAEMEVLSDVARETLDIVRPKGQIPPAQTNFADMGIAPNPDFVGREKELAQLHERLVSDGLTVALTQAVIGEGGFGKSEIAKHYAFTFAREKFRGLWWISASKESIEASTTALALSLGVPLRGNEEPGIIRNLIRAHLRKSEGPHLLILDNLEDADRIQHFLLDSPSCLLVTTRYTGIPPALAQMLEIDVLDRSDSIKLLRKHRPDLEEEEHEVVLDEIADHLGDHALALAFAAAYLRRKPHPTPKNLLERLKSNEIGAEDHPLGKINPKALGTGYERHVADALALHLPEFKDTTGLAILLLAAFCHPDRIPIDLFRDAMTIGNDEVDNWLGRLAEVSIIRFNKGGMTISIHRLTQSVLRGLIGKETAPLQAVVAVLGQRFAGALDYTRWAMQDAYATHAAEALGHAGDVEAIKGAGNLGNQLGLYLQNRVRYADALTALREAERIDRAAFGEDHPNVAACVNNIGRVLKAQGDLSGALKCYRDAERIGRAAFGDDHPKVAICVNNIGSVLHDQGDLAGALKCFRDAERIDRAAFGDDHPEVAVDINNIGSVLQAQGDLAGALKCYRDAERIDRAAFGDDHPMVAIRVNNIGGVLKAQGDLAGALKCYRDAERIDRAAFGDDHPMVAIRVNNIGGVLQDQGDLAGALECYREAFRIFLVSLGSRSLNTVTCAGNLFVLDVDPIAYAREITDDATAADLLAALRERYSEHSGQDEEGESGSTPSPA